ncbi:ganglioside GM2 activator-like [Lineus longissimus]|uniref:ganglioside GM2 activator-like n=1 Tax=Lineus longissimus TaxID=88925 RepID=UPI002B4D51E7
MMMNAKLQLMLHVLVIIQAVWVEAACGKRSRRKREHKHLHYEDCGSNPSNPIHFLHLAAHPMPIITPGRLRLSFRINITEQLPANLMLNVTVIKRIFGFEFQVPCIEGRYGTCIYRDVCNSLNSRFESNCDCPNPLLLNGIPCTCPIQPGDYRMNNVDIHIPKLDGMLGTLAQGDYQVRAQIQDDITREQLGCISMKVSLRKRKERRSGWFFGRRFR